MKFVCLIFAGVSLAACNNDSSPSNKELNEKEKMTNTKERGIDKIQFISYGPSVAPVYNRGYVVTFTPGRLTIEIKSYDSVLNAQERNFTAEQFNTLRSALEGLEPEPLNDNPQVGGSSSSVILYKEGKKVVERHQYSSQFYVGGNVFQIAEWVPDIDTLVDKTREKDQ